MIKLRGKITPLLLMPALAIVLPWSWFYRLARVFSRFQWLYKTETQSAVKEAATTGQFLPDEIWKRHFRLNKIIDGVDPWLSMFRSNRWMDRHIDVEGSWPATGSFIANSIHLGAGFWVLRHIRENAHPISVIMRPFDEWQNSFSRPMHSYLIAYEKAMISASGAPKTYTGRGFTQRFETNLNAGYNQLSMMDVPRGKNMNALGVEFLGRPTYFANGVISLALKLHRPVVPYVMLIDIPTGRRKLHIGQPIAENQSLPEAMDELARFFDPFTRKHSAAWQLWGQYAAFMNSEFKLESE